MKELSIEQKARAYDESLGRAKEYLNSPRTCFDIDQLYNIFPVLREDDNDENVRKALISFLKSPFVNENITDEKVAPWLAWVEKQGEKDKEILILKDKIESLHAAIKAIKETSKIEEKIDNEFKIGDWVVTSYGKVNQIIAVDEDNYGFTLDDGSYFSGSWKDSYHLWSIEDAKPGDILYCESLGVKFIMILKCINKNGSLDSYCRYNTIDGFGVDVPKVMSINDDPKPATKEQCDLLFLKMNKSGYEWSEDTHELKEIDQIPTDNPGPKFHEGDWTVSNLDGKARRISEVHFDEYNSYYVVNGMPVNLEEFDRRHHLWSIKDVKPGDILSNGKMIVIFKKFAEPSYKQHIIAYIGLDIFGRIQITNEHWELGIDKAKPAIKEKCDLLFQKMKEYGYTWNDEKKELLEIEEELTDFEKSLKHIMIETLECGDTRNLKADAEMLLRLANKPKEWSHEDDVMVHDILGLLPVKTRPEYNQRREDWLKSLKGRVQPQELNEEDEDMVRYIGNAITCKESAKYLEEKGIDMIKAHRWLESFKPQLKQEWGEDDEKMCKNILECLRNGWRKLPTDILKYESWLKSFKYKSNWKPSNEQIIALRWVLNNIPYNRHKEEISGLLGQIKKL